MASASAFSCRARRLAAILLLILGAVSILDTTSAYTSQPPSSWIGAHQHQQTAETANVVLYSTHIGEATDGSAIVVAKQGGTQTGQAQRRLSCRDTHPNNRQKRNACQRNNRRITALDSALSCRELWPSDSKKRSECWSFRREHTALTSTKSCLELWPLSSQAAHRKECIAIRREAREPSPPAPVPPPPPEPASCRDRFPNNDQKRSACWRDARRARALESTLSCRDLWPTDSKKRSECWSFRRERTALTSSKTCLELWPLSTQAAHRQECVAIRTEAGLIRAGDAIPGSALGDIGTTFRGGMAEFYRDKGLDAGDATFLRGVEAAIAAQDAIAAGDGAEARRIIDDIKAEFGGSWNSGPWCGGDCR